MASAGLSTAGKRSKRHQCRLADWCPPQSRLANISKSSATHDASRKPPQSAGHVATHTEAQTVAVIICRHWIDKRPRSFHSWQPPRLKGNMDSTRGLLQRKSSATLNSSACARRTQGAAAGGEELGHALGPGGRAVAHQEAAVRARAAAAGRPRRACRKRCEYLCATHSYSTYVGLCAHFTHRS